MDKQVSTDNQHKWMRTITGCVVGLVVALVFLQSLNITNDGVQRNANNIDKMAERVRRIEDNQTRLIGLTETVSGHLLRISQDQSDTKDDIKEIKAYIETLEASFERQDDGKE